MRNILIKQMFLVLAVLGSGVTGQAFAGDVRVAVAADFMDPARKIAASFYKNTHHRAPLSFSATGQLFSRINQGVPYEVFLAADAEHPRKLEADELAVPDSRFTYAIGKIALWSRSSGLVQGDDLLRKGDFRQLAMADPTNAPYGVAAVEALTDMGLYTTLKPKIVLGKDIAQAYRLVASRRAELGIIAMSEIVRADAGSYWEFPRDSYKPILQQAVLLQRGVNNPAAHAFMKFLRGPQARAIIRAFGYEVE